jgi:DnaD/phage-associated family protein
MVPGNGKTFDRDLQPIALPASFFNKLLPAIDDLPELKVTIFSLAALQQKEGDYRFLRYNEFAADERMMHGLAIIDDSATALELLNLALDKAIDRGTLLMAEVTIESKTERYYTAADEGGRALHQRIQAGEWRPSADGEIELLPARPSIYGLYEENIGILTPMIAESIKDAEATYPQDWIEEALRLAVEGNKRNWRYIRAILERWQQEGRSRETSGGYLERHKRYTVGEWKDHIES